MIGPAILWACLAVGPAQADMSDDAFVREVASRVAAAMHDEKYAVALSEIERAEATRPLPDFVFMRAKVEETRGNCVAAVSLYDRFLETEPGREDAEVARAGRARCGGKDDEEDVPTRSSGDAGAPKPWYTDPAGGALVIGGTVAAGVGLGLFVQARADVRAAEGADNLEQHERFGDRSRKLGIAAATVLATGGALVLGGVIRYVIVGRRSRLLARKNVTLGPGLRVRF